MTESMTTVSTHDRWRRWVSISIVAALWSVSGAGVRAGLNSDFVRGDVNQNERIEISDAVSVLRYLFQGEANIAAECLDATDADDDGGIQVTDAIYLLNYLFLGGSVLPLPYPDCGADSALTDELGCEHYAPCEVAEATFYGEAIGVADTGVYFAVDRSGSLQGDGTLDVAKQEIVGVLSALPANSRFGIVFFDAAIQKFPAGGMPSAPTDEVRAAAIDWVSSMPRGGGSCPENGLEEALSFVAADPMPRNLIFYVGDGGGTCRGVDERTYLERMIEQVTAQNEHRAEIHSVLVGRSCTQAFYATFFTQLSEANDGTFRCIGN